MFESVAARNVPWLRHALLGAVSLGLSLMCAMFVFGSPTEAPPVNTEPMSVAINTVEGDPTPVTAAAPALMEGMCDGVCASDTETACSLAAVAPLTLLGLQLTRRRRSFVLLPRPTETLRIQRLHRTWRGWFLLSPVSLCTWRV